MVNHRRLYDQIKFKDIVSSNQNTILLDLNGSAWVFGYGAAGQFGNNTIPFRSGTTLVAQQVIGNHSFVSLAACPGMSTNTGATLGGLKADGSFWVWGTNGAGIGRLGDNTATDRSSPVKVAGTHSFIRVAPAAGNFAALKADGSVWTWGYSGSGALAQPDANHRSSPTLITGNHSFVFLSNKISYSESYGSYFTLKDDGSCWAWGYNGSGSLGDFSITSRSSPVSVVGNHSFTFISAGNDFTLGLKSDGSCWSWGTGTAYQLGDGTAVSKSSPVLVLGNHSFVSIAAGDSYSTAVKADGSVWGWGYNTYLQLGANSTYSSPVVLSGYNNIVKISPSYGTIYAIDSAGDFWVSGRNFMGLRGDYNLSNITIPQKMNIKNIKYSKNHSVNVYNNDFDNQFDVDNQIIFKNTEQERILIGNNDYFQTGVNKLFDIRPQITDVGKNSIQKIATSTSFSLILKDNGKLYGCGLVDLLGINNASNNGRYDSVKVYGNHNFTKISKNGFFCLKNDGSVYAWGYNGDGQLADNSKTNRSAPVSVVGNHSFINVYSNIQCYDISALKADGSAWTWGSNGYGQLGDMTASGKSSPVSVVGNHSFNALVLGAYSIYGLKNDGSVYAWGYNSGGELGDNTKTSKSSPISVVGNHSFTKITAGSGLAFGLKSDGTAWGWGGSYLGNNSTAGASSPVQVAGSHSFIDISTGMWASYGLKVDGTLWSWGYNNLGQLGDLTTSSKSSPVSVVGNHSFTNMIATESGVICVKANADAWLTGAWMGYLFQNAISSSSSSPVLINLPSNINLDNIAFKRYQNLAYLDNGICYTRGKDTYGELGAGYNTNYVSYPLEVMGNHSFIDVSVSTSHSLALKLDGSVWSWGAASNGQLGDNTATYKTSPVRVTGDHSFIAINANFVASHALKADGTLWSWGTGRAIGDGTLLTRSSPVQVAGNHSFVNFIGGYANIMAYKADGSMWFWGYPGSGGAPIGYTYTNPYPIIMLPGFNFDKISNGDTHCVALVNSNGSAWTWGAGTNGKLGDLTTTAKSSPVSVAGNHSFVDVCAGYGYAFGLKSDGTLWGWGGNGGSLGDNTGVNASSPVSVIGNHSFASIGFAGGNVLTLKGDGTCWTWGAGTYGRLGDNTLTLKSSPVSVVGNHSFIQVVGGSSFSCAVKANGTAWSWGANAYLMLGDGTSTGKSSPVSVVGNHSFIQIASGANHTQALKADGTAWGWGYGDYGNLGNNTTSRSSSPVSVVGNHSFISLSVGCNISYGVKADGTLWGWGNGYYGALSVDSMTAKSSPVLVNGINSAISCDAGRYAYVDWNINAIIKQSDGYYFLGYHSSPSKICNPINEYLSYRLSPIRVMGLPSGKTPIKIIGSKESVNPSNAYLASDGSVWHSGKLADNGYIGGPNRIFQVADTSSFVDIFAGQSCFYAVKADGSIYGWGNNSVGQLGTGDFYDRTSPTLIQPIRW